MLIARTNEKSYLNNYRGEDWAPVTVTYMHYPSGYRKCYEFPDGFRVKAELCEVKEI